MTKTIYKNYVIDYTDVVYVKNETELLWLIESGIVYHKN